MKKKLRNEYKPDYAIPPGETLIELMQLANMGTDNLAKEIKMPRSKVKAFLEGKTPISKPLAKKLAKVFDIPENFLINLERNYQTTKRRIVRDRKIV